MSNKLKSLDVCGIQVYIDNVTQLTHIIKEIAGQIGPSDVIISTYSTSEQFVRSIYKMREKSLIKSITLIADLKAAKKTLRLREFIINTFDDVRLTENHSKIVLFSNDKYAVSVITSQNQTRGNRTEAGVVTTSLDVFNTIKAYLIDIIEHKSVSLLDVVRR